MEDKVNKENLHKFETWDELFDTMNGLRGNTNKKIKKNIRAVVKQEIKINLI